MTDKKKDSPTMTAQDKDSIDQLPLSMIPLSSATLKAAKLIKNTRMETTLELHSDPISGSLQISPDAIAESFSMTEQDQQIIKSLANLHSYDVYSLRTNLKQLGIEVDQAALELSDDMKSSLNAYAVEFTRPLIEQIFGNGSHIDPNDDEGLQKILRDPDVGRVRENLNIMTKKTGIPLDQIPDFLKSYSDIFLSVAYYRHGFETMHEDVQRMQMWLAELRSRKDVSAQTIAGCKRAENILKLVIGSLNDRLEKFDHIFEAFWKDINQNSFLFMRQKIENNHDSMGSVLCGLIVKVRHWSSEFPDNAVGGPTKRAAYLKTSLEPGLDVLHRLENTARERLGLPPLK